MFPERPVNIGTIGPVSPSKSQFAETMRRHSLLMPPGKKTKNTLACVFTVANVLGTCHWYHCSLLIYVVEVHGIYVDPGRALSVHTGHTASSECCMHGHTSKCRWFPCTVCTHKVSVKS